jgi:CspA family cold shock protein
MTGTIKTLVSDRGFGFITLTDGTEAFFHRSSLADSAASFDLLTEGDQVECDVDANSPKGPRASNVQVKR